MNKICTKLMGKKNLFAFINMFALSLAISTVNAACIWLMYQPDLPDELKKYKK